MSNRIRMGIPEMDALWQDLSSRFHQSTLDKGELRFFNKWVKALGFLQENPRHNSLATHKIDFESVSGRHQAGDRVRITGRG